MVNIAMFPTEIAIIMGVYRNFQTNPSIFYNIYIYNTIVSLMCVIYWGVINFKKHNMDSCEMKYVAIPSLVEGYCWST